MRQVTLHNAVAKQSGIQAGDSTRVPCGDSVVTQPARVRRFMLADQVTERLRERARKLREAIRVKTR